MALVVEDGTGKSDAESYLSVADADTYHAARGNPAAWDGASTGTKETALREATEYLDLTFGPSWKGQRKVETQALDWPRTDVYDRDDFSVDDAALPVDLERATAEAALRAISEDLIPDIAEPGSIKRERLKAGPVETETEYAGGKSQTKRFPRIEQLVSDLVSSGVGELRLERG